MWVEWVDGARSGDAGAREELVNYFTPFVHAVLACHLATQHANEHVARVLEDAVARIAEPKDALAFGPWLLEQARVRARELSHVPGTTLELPGGGAVITEGKRVLSRLRHLPDARRERLAFRLLEGITGAEIAEATGASVAEVRGDLEQGLAALVSELGGGPANAVGDTYLWSLVGTPHAAVVPLENQLTPLRYDPSAPPPPVESPVPDVLAGASDLTPTPTPTPVDAPDVTPVQAPRPLSGEGRKPTAPELKAVRPSPAADEPQTTPIGVKLVDEPTQAPLAEESTSVLPGADASAEERTRNATDLPVAALENPFAAQPGTVPASDLPVAAGIDRSSQPLHAAQPDDLGASPAPPTRLRPRTMEVQALKTGTATVDKKAEDPDSTAPRGAPLSFLAREHESPASTQAPADPGQDWRTSALERETTNVADVEKPRPFSFIRGATPFVIACVLFVFFGVVAYINIRSTEVNVRRGWSLVPIVVASESLPEGTTIDFNMISTREVPDVFVTSSVVKPDSSAYLLNQRLIVPVQGGDPLLWSQFESNKSKERLSTRISRKMRAYTIEAEDITSVGGWVQPGDYVDFVITVKNPDTQEQTAATTLPDLQVIATGKISESSLPGYTKPGQQRYANVSVLAIPEEIEVLALMRLRASYRMVLRARDDHAPLEPKATTPDTLMSGARMSMLHKKRSETIIPLIRNSVPAPSR